ncbi:potassium voltage-gated channel subfamily F member 1 [Triplophysa dalaica]|uniref:potassium voltage-gated channel subfamily F member 1 n=1 Tax=Triplophysa dalaica TaxID=1582913 RepID=UPI0024DF79B2|nr:potassium voltage-gated channel subfamily F member 1 [Triplophysa dalaica]
MWTLPRTRFAHCNGSSSGDEREVAVNIGGVRLVLCGELLNRYPESRLAELVNCSPRSFDVISSVCDDYDPGKREFYFDRDPDSFKCIVEVYYFGEIHMKRGICPICFIKEMEFWKIDLSYLDECCKSNLNEKEEELAEIADKVKMILDDLDSDPDVSRNERWQKFTWKLMEKPDSSLTARVIAIVSFLFILVSSFVMCIGTIPDLQVEDSEGNRVEHPTLDAIETACIGWFTVEYVLRLASSPNKLRFALSFMNIIDFMAILPFYVVLILTYLGTAMMELANVQQAVQALRIMRIARIFKLARHSSGLQTLTYALKSSFKELGLLLMYMGVGIFVFSALGYTMEQSHPETLFRSIPQSFWWAIITMTTVGYGDIYPKTTLGRCNAAISFLCGVIAIALPIHPIINNFVIYYNKQKVLETAAKHELELMELRSLELAMKSTSRRCDASGRAWEGAMRASRSDTFIPLLSGSQRSERESVKKRSLS